MKYVITMHIDSHTRSQFRIKERAVSFIGGLHTQTDTLVEQELFLDNYVGRHILIINESS